MFHNIKEESLFLVYDILVAVVDAQGNCFLAALMCMLEIHNEKFL